MPALLQQSAHGSTISRWALVGMFVALGSIVSVPHVRAEETEHAQIVQIVPTILDGQPVYPSRHASVPVSMWEMLRWQDVTVPASWVNKGYYLELWDGGNRPIPGFTAQKLTKTALPLTTIDATLYPDIRIVLFQPAALPVPKLTEPVTFSFTTQPNIRLRVLLGLLALLCAAFIASIIRFRLHPKALLTQTRIALRSRQYTTSLSTIAALFVLVMLWSAVFGVIVGSFVGGVQIFYVLVKLPLLLLAALLISGLSLIILLQLSGVRASAAEIIIFSFHVLTVLSVTLASLSPILLLLIVLQTSHDVLLLWLLACCALGGGIAIVRCWQFLRQFLRRPLPALAVWIVLYGVVVLQLGWLLRPWVGVVDPVRKSLPFSRLYAGNVFLEVEKTFSRVVKQQ